jgi:hypothetical protein
MVASARQFLLLQSSGTHQSQRQRHSRLRHDRLVKTALVDEMD